jgi:hypothetical protein
MTVRVWTCAAYLPIYQCGGWAYVREGRTGLEGAAGGDRHTTLELMVFAGLAAALKTLPKGDTPVAIYTPHTELVGLARHLVAGTQPDDLSAEVQPVWAIVLALAANRPMRLIHMAAEARTPIAFTLAWAELARDKAKATGHFLNVIPKPNLAKVPGL